MRKPLLAGVASLAIVHAARAVELHNNGTFVTGTSPGGNTISQIQAGYDTFGLVAGGYSATPQRVADNFIIPSGGWDLDTLTVYGYQSGGVVNPFTSAYVGIFDFDPTGMDNLFPRYGDLDPLSAPNSFVSQTDLNIFRVGAATPDDVSRRIHSITLDLSSIPVLPPGEYFFAVGLQGTTSLSVVAVVPVAPTPAHPDALSYGRIRHSPPGRENFWQYADGSIATAEDPNLIQPYEHAFKLDGTQVSVNEWAGPGGGTYGATTANWTQASIPGGVDAVASFLGNITANSTVTVAAPVTLGRINFNNANSYTLGGTGPITLQGGQGHAQINVLGGSHTINTPLTLNSNLNLVVQPANATLTIGGPLEGLANIVKRGAGVAQTTRVNVVELMLREGTLRIAPNGTSTGTSRVNRFFVDVGVTPRAKLDIINNAFVYDYDPADGSPLQRIRSLIISGYNNGSWDGNGIISSLADGSNHGIGYAEASVLTSVPAIFGTTDTDTVVFRFTRYGDANLDGQVNLQDFNSLAANFGSGDEWHEGDFNYDGFVNLQDFNRLAGNFGLSASLDGPTPEDWAHLAAAVPEPGAVFLTVMVAALTLRRQRRGCSVPTDFRLTASDSQEVD